MDIEIKKIIKKINKGEVPRGYKKTKVGIIPNEWPYDRFKNIVKQSQYGLSLAKNIKGNIKILDMSHLQNGHIVNKDMGCVSITPNEYENYVIKKGDFLFNRTNSYDLVGKSAVAKKDYEFVFASYLVRFKFKEECNFQYIGEWFALSHKTNIIKRLVTKGVSQCNINPTELQKYFYIPLPPLPEQQKIAEILSNCDKLIELKEKLIKQKKYQKKYLIQALLNPKSPNFRQLAGFDGKWEEVKLGEIINEVSEKTNKNNQYLIFSITKNGIKKQSEYFKKQVASDDNTGYKVIRKGNLIFSCMNLWMGSLDILRDYEVGIVSPAYKTFIIDCKKNSINFIFYYLKTHRMLWLYKINSEQGASVVRRNLDLKGLLSSKILMPHYKEQKAISYILVMIDQEISLLEKELEQQKLKKKALMQLLLTGKVRVRVS